jgi:hypothetical protein
MKTAYLLLLGAVLLLPACAGPAARHDARVDRRYDRRDRVSTYAGDPAARRTDRAYDRADRIDNRYDSY